MNTDAWIDLLARGAGAAPQGLAQRRLVPAAGVGLLGSAVLALVLLGPLPASAFRSGFPWMKLGYTGALALAAGWLASRAARPLARSAPAGLAVGGVVLAMVAAGAWTLAVGTAPGTRLEALLGHSWLQCPWLVAGFSLPALALSLWAVRGLAPTRPRRAGLAAGLLAGAVGAFGYALACPEASVAFVAIWYTAGIALTGALGAALGPWCLRW